MRDNKTVVRKVQVLGGSSYINIPTSAHANKGDHAIVRVINNSDLAGRLLRMLELNLKDEGSKIDYVVNIMKAQEGEKIE